MPLDKNSPNKHVKHFEIKIPENELVCVSYTQTNGKVLTWYHSTTKELVYRKGVTQKQLNKIEALENAKFYTVKAMIRLDVESAIAKDKGKSIGYTDKYLSLEPGRFKMISLPRYEVKEVK